MWDLLLLDEAARELRDLPGRERAALENVMTKLITAGPTLPFPHQSAVRGQAGLRELRPRAGRSPWRALYQRVGDRFIVAAIGPEAQSDPRAFDRAVSAAVQRLEESR